MTELSWAHGLALWFAASIAFAVVWSLVMGRARRRDEDDWDWTADQKRRIERRAKQLSREFK